MKFSVDNFWLNLIGDDIKNTEQVENTDRDGADTKEMANGQASPLSSNSPTNDKRKNKKIGDYIIGKSIGMGSFGKVK